MSAPLELNPLRGFQALQKFIEEAPERVLDIGAGEEKHTDQMIAAGMTVVAVDFLKDEDYMDHNGTYDGIWCCHVLEHQRSPGLFLDKIYRDLEDDGLLSITVPPAKHNLVGGHVSIWNAGLLLYHMVLAGFDCSEARVGTYGYNISVMVRKKAANLPPLKMDRGDIKDIAEFFPTITYHGMDGQFKNINW